MMPCSLMKANLVMYILNATTKLIKTMIDKTELRIGNLVASTRYFETHQYFKVDTIEARCVLAVKKCGKKMAMDYEELDPIPLTPEWLIRLGATKASDKLMWLSLSSLRAEIHFEIYEKEIVSIIKNDFGELILNPIKYVHTFQNAIYALTGEELTIK